MRFHKDERKDPPIPFGCTCGKPLGIVIRPGEHIHPCPIHPDVAIYGQVITC